MYLKILLIFLLSINCKAEYILVNYEDVNYRLEFSSKEVKYIDRLTKLSIKLKDCNKTIIKDLNLSISKEIKKVRGKGINLYYSNNRYKLDKTNNPFFLNFYRYFFTLKIESSLACKN